MSGIVRLPATAQEAPIRVMVVDDEPVARQRLARLLAAIPGVVLVGVHGSGRDALQAIGTAEPEVVLLDIAMPGLDGLDVARRAAARPGGGPLVVFVTAYDEHALEAFRVHAADYVLKPTDQKRLGDALEHARAHVRRRRAERAALATEAAAVDAAHLARIALRDGHRTHHVPVPDLLWIESFGNYTRVFTPASRYIHRATMAAVAAQLAPHGFVRIHRTVIVNSARVRELRPRGSGHCEVVLDTGARLPVSRTFRGAIERLLRGSDPGD
jgi:two-component system LytT family response regulator